MRIYHGSPQIVERPDFAHGKPNNDYGLGFYCTDDLALANEWACPHPAHDGFCNVYELDESGLVFLDLDDAPGGVLSWVATLMRFRQVRYNSKHDVAAVQDFIAAYSRDFAGIDIVTGYRADDSYFEIVRAFVSNSLSVDDLERCLRLGGLGRQIVLKSQRALDALKFVAADQVDAAEWNERRDSRNYEANAAFRQILTAGPSKDGTYFIDVVRGL